MVDAAVAATVAVVVAAGPVALAAVLATASGAWLAVRSPRLVAATVDAVAGESGAIADSDGETAVPAVAAVAATLIC
jgi:hypothetical protein